VLTDAFEAEEGGEGEGACGGEGLDLALGREKGTMLRSLKAISRLVLVSFCLVIKRDCSPKLRYIIIYQTTRVSLLQREYPASVEKGTVD
jgi:hypothetical protein